MFDFRQFEATDAFGHDCKVSFLWQQNAISIRHADAIDVKFVVNDGQSKEEKVIALPHPKLKALAGKLSREINDAWCNKLAAFHLKTVIETGDDLEKALITMTDGDLEKANRSLESARIAAV